MFFILFCILLSFVMMCSFETALPESASTQATPYPDSPVIADIAWDWDSYVQAAPGSDLWPTTWAADGNIYSSWGDGGGFGGSNSDGRVPLGFARIEGPPENYVGVNVWGGKNPEYDNQATFGGKATGMISVDGALYAWINIENDDPPDFQLAWSSDLGATWQMETWNFPGGSGNFFPNTFLNFGQDNAGARDDFVYFYGRIWDDVNNVYLGRAPKGSIRNRATYKFFRGLNANDDPIWNADVTKCQPVFTDPTNGRPAASVSFNPGLNRYIMTVPHGGVGKLGVFDAPEPWGPWTTIAYYDNWGGFGNSDSLYYYFPTKWISADGKTMWMVFSSTNELDAFNLVRADLIPKLLPFKQYAPVVITAQ